MIPGGDHSTRSLLHRRVSSWADAVSVNSPVPDEYSILASDDDADDDANRSQPLLPDLEYEEESLDDVSITSRRRKNRLRLWLVFFLMVMSGVGSVVLAKLQSLPMYNYPTFLTLYSNFWFIIISFSYILPVAYFGWFHNTIPRRHLRVSKKPFLVMGFLDALTSALQVLASVYLPGTLLVLLPQAAIPLSMIASRLILRERFTRRQFVGAAVVFCGILVVLIPVFTHNESPEFFCRPVEEENCAICKMETTEEDCMSHVVNEELEHQRRIDEEQEYKLSMFTTNIIKNNINRLPKNKGNDDDDNIINYCQWISRKESLRKDDVLVFVWSLVMLGSCVPMVFSSVYKQVALQVELDPILVNGWVSLFQFLFGLPLAVPAGLVSSPKVKPFELLSNWSQASDCLFKRTNSVGAGCHPDDCSEATLWVHLFLLSSAVFTLSMMFVLKYGSSSLLYLGLTLMVPLGHLVFSLHAPSSIGIFDILGLIVLVSGLILYRFGHEPQRVSPEPVSGSQSPQERRAGTDQEGETGGEDSNQCHDGFLEFLREPFMLMGDI